MATAPRKPRAAKAKAAPAQAPSTPPADTPPADTPPLAAAAAIVARSDAELRGFEVVSTVDHDGVRYEPGAGLLVVDQDTHARLRRGLSIETDWDDGARA